MNKLEQLFAGKRLLIVTHQHGDVDAIGTAIVLAESLKNVTTTTIVSPGTVSRPAVQLAKTLGYAVVTEVDLSEFNATAIVDTSSPDHISPLDATKLPRPLAVIDHHGPSKFQETSLEMTELLPSCVEVLLPYLGELSKTARIAALASITADTRQFTRASKPTFETVVSLIQSASDYEEALAALRTEPDVSEKIAVLKALQKLKLEKHDHYLLAYCRAGSFEATVANQLVRLGADVAIVVAEKDDGCRVTGRMARRVEGRLNLGTDVFEQVGKLLNGSGGGHSAAASANLKSDPEKALSLTVKVINRLLTASFSDSDDRNVAPQDFQSP